jgi:hypothetical protein
MIACARATAASAANRQESRTSNPFVRAQNVFVRGGDRTRNGSNRAVIDFGHA